MATKRQIINEIFKLTDSREAYEKVKNTYSYLRFLGLNFKYAMAVDVNKFSKSDYIYTLNRIKEALA